MMIRKTAKSKTWSEEAERTALWLLRIMGKTSVVRNFLKILRTKNQEFSCEKFLEDSEENLDTKIYTITDIITH